MGWLCKNHHWQLYHFSLYSTACSHADYAPDNFIHFQLIQFGGILENEVLKHILSWKIFNLKNLEFDESIVFGEHETVNQWNLDSLHQAIDTAFLQLVHSKPNGQFENANQVGCLKFVHLKMEDSSETLTLQFDLPIRQNFDKRVEYGRSGLLHERCDLVAVNQLDHRNEVGR